MSFNSIGSRFFNEMGESSLKSNGLFNLSKYNFAAKKKLEASPEKTTTKKVTKTKESPAKKAEAKPTNKTNKSTPKTKSSAKPKASKVADYEGDDEEMIEEEEIVEVPVKSKRIKKSTSTSTTKAASKATKEVKETPSKKAAPIKKTQKKQEEVEIEEDEEEEIVEAKEVKPKKKATVTKAKITKTTKVEETEKVPVPPRAYNWKIDLTRNPEDLGKLPLCSKTAPMELENFPFDDGKSPNPFDNYVNSNRVGLESKKIITAEKDYICSNYAPLPVVIKQAKGYLLEDIEGYRYVDCLTGYGSVNFGHGNTKILAEAIKQTSTLYMTSRALYNNKQHEVGKLITSLFKKDKVIFMNSGVEACETAVKFARRWGYQVKNIPENQAKVVYMSGNFWGRSLTAVGTSDEAARSKDFGPFDDGKYIVNYNDLEDLENKLKSDSNICAVMVEPIQGEAGIIIPDPEYLRGVSQLCKQYNALYIDDEVQAGMGRSGNMLAVDGVLGPDNRPDMIILGKSLSNGVYPVSAVLANNDVMDLIKPGDHGSTYSGNPLGMAITKVALETMISDNNAVLTNANKVGSFLALLVYSLQSKFVKEVRGRGMFIGVEFHHDIPISASDLCLLLMERGMITKPTHKYNIRIAPPLTITYKDASVIYEILAFVLKSLEEQYPDYQNSEKAEVNIEHSAETVEVARNYLQTRPQVPIVYKKVGKKHAEYIEQIFEEKKTISPPIDFWGNSSEQNSVESQFSSISSSEIPDSFLNTLQNTNQDVSNNETQDSQEEQKDKEKLSVIDQ
eukprot:CAMPEP_0170515880 /NCGR_PEP_ID=MMETSP0209-20121228/2267_1 /TAXON_ID=665100 ORGANISM="Litonotus pictus, Strain P1" /NCGR_SAMPLE_ID=MMETSP0209 /ASSEMBLY_ACC=CAM_ASM_000301 /LENGTH=788 /DNA_ID=CAMNT_0010800581 /DNA_START=38 /DNA_END=2401 /DNA_ORIENTATION=+